jgi:hypothetical protein
MTATHTQSFAVAQVLAQTERIVENLNPQEVFKSHPFIEQAFVLRSRSLCCVDEGVAFGIHLPGSGVLIPFEQLQKEVVAAEITELTTHDNCGAYALKFPNDRDANLGTFLWGQATAKLLGLPHRHIKAEDMVRLDCLHNAAVVYYDGTGSFNCIAGLPCGFVVSRKYFSSAQEDLELCIKIAFGHHGCGDLFTPQRPLRVVVLSHPTDPKLSELKLRREVAEVIELFGPRVKMVTVKV